MSDMSSPRVLIYLLRQDLRIADNPILHEICKSGQQSRCTYTHLLPVYCFPAQQIEVSGFLSSESERSPHPEARSQVAGFWRCGQHRARFVAESVWDLKKSLESIGSGLEIRVGMLGQVVKDMLDAFGRTDSEVIDVWMTAEEGVEEKREERDVRKAVKAVGKEFKLWVDEKYYIDEYVRSSSFLRRGWLPRPPKPLPRSTKELLYFIENLPLLRQKQVRY